MSLLRHQHQHLLKHYLENNIKQSHPCQPMIKNYIYSCKRNNINLMSKLLESINELSKNIGEDNIKDLLFLMSQDHATSSNIFECANIYKKNRNIEEYKYNLKKNKKEKNKVNIKMEKTKLKRNTTI
tara:strand:+ start:145 stop:525 length:381 start_codon:yes stop_codon:yes gene_type:complete